MRKLTADRQEDYKRDQSKGGPKEDNFPDRHVVRNCLYADRHASEETTGQDPQGNAERRIFRSSAHSLSLGSTAAVTELNLRKGVNVDRRMSQEAG